MLACLIFASSASAINNQALDRLDRQPDLINLKSQAMSQEHIKQASLGHTDALVQANYIEIDLTGLNTIKGDDGKFYSVNDTQMSGHQISMRLPNINKPVLLNVESVQNLIRGEDVVTYTGYVADSRNNFFTLSVFDDGVMAKINYGKYIYIITPLKGLANKHSVSQLEKKLMIKDTGNHEVYGVRKAKNAKNHVEKSSNGSGRVDVLFYYASDINWPSGYVATIVSEMNNVLSDSLVSSNNYITSAGLKLANSSFPDMCNTPIELDIQQRKNVFSNLDQDLVSYGADLMFLLTSTQLSMDCSAPIPTGDNVPWGRVGGKGAPLWPEQPWAFSTHTFALGDLTAIHELGHVFGGRHNSDIIDDNDPATLDIQQGVTATDGSWQTMMGGYGMNGCNFSTYLKDPDCERIGFFSNPQLSYMGVPIGVAGSRDMESWLELKMPVVSGWRGTAVLSPIAPNPISVESLLCYGMNIITWTPPTGATDYKLYSSTSSGFNSPVLIYSGTQIVTSINVGSGTLYLRAKACNAAGCSAYSNQTSASRVNGCF